MEHTNAEATQARTELTNDADALREVQEGDTLTVSYRSTQSGVGTENDQEVTAEVDSVDFSECQGFLFGYIYLSVHRDEDDNLPRRRLRVQDDEVIHIEARRTTRQGAQWQSISRTTSTEVYEVREVLTDGGEDESEETFTVEVYQPRASSQYLNEDNTEVQEQFEDLYYDLRDLKAGMVDGEDLTHEDFTRLYTLAGGDQIQAEDEQSALHAAFEQWNNGSGRESEAFRQANQEHRAVSLSAGHIVSVDGTRYFCAPVGWTEVDL